MWNLVSALARNLVLGCSDSPARIWRAIWDAQILQKEFGVQYFKILGFPHIKYSQQKNPTAFLRFRVLENSIQRQLSDSTKHPTRFSDSISSPASSTHPYIEMNKMTQGDGRNWYEHVTIHVCSSSCWINHRRILYASESSNQLNFNRSTSVKCPHLLPIYIVMNKMTGGNEGI